MGNCHEAKVQNRPQLLTDILIAAETGDNPSMINLLRQSKRGKVDIEDVRHRALAIATERLDAEMVRSLLRGLKLGGLFVKEEITQLLDDLMITLCGVRNSEEDLNSRKMQFTIAGALLDHGAGGTIYWRYESFNHRYDFLRAAIKAGNAPLVAFLLRKDSRRVTEVGYGPYAFDQANPATTEILLHFHPYHTVDFAHAVRESAAANDIPKLNVLINSFGKTENKVQMAFFRGSCLGGLDCDFRILEAFIQMRSLEPKTEQEDRITYGLVLTARMISYSSEYKRQVMLLIKAGADASSSSQGEGGHCVLERLLDAGLQDCAVEYLERNNTGGRSTRRCIQSSLFGLVKKGNIEGVLFLLNNGADGRMPNKLGRLAAEFAVSDQMRVLLGQREIQGAQIMKETDMNRK